MLNIRLAEGCDCDRWYDWCENLEQTFSKAIRVLKNDKTSTVWLTKMADRWVVVKRINEQTFWVRLRRAFKKSRPQVNWQNAHYLLRLGIPTFIPLSVVEAQKGPFPWGVSYLVCSYLEGVSALDFFTQNPLPPDWQEKAQGLIDLMLKLKKNRISHRDLNPSNLLWCDQQWHLLDLDAMRVHSCDWIAERYFKRECARFLDNWRDVPHISTEFLQYLTQTLSKIS